MTDAPTTDATIAVFGATGQTGRHAVRHAPGNGHRVRALARDPGKRHIEDDMLTVTKGDLDSFEALRKTVTGATHVIRRAGGTCGKGYDRGMMTRFIARLWPILDAEASVRTFLFQSVFFAPEPDGSNPVILKLLAPVATVFTGATDMLRDNSAVTKIVSAYRDVSFDTIVTRPRKDRGKGRRRGVVGATVCMTLAIRAVALGVSHGWTRGAVMITIVSRLAYVLIHDLGITTIATFVLTARFIAVPLTAFGIFSETVP